MTAQSDPYVRVYYRIVDDPKFETVYDNDRLLANWLRLLVAADAMYPAPAQIPQGIRRDVLDTMASVGLIELLPGRRFHMVGLRAERERRTAQAKKAADSRWKEDAGAMREQSVSNAGAFGNGMHSEPLRSEPIRTTPISSIKLVEPKKPFVTMTDEEKKAAREKDRQELMEKVQERLGVKP